MINGTEQIVCFHSPAGRSAILATALAGARDKNRPVQLCPTLLKGEKKQGGVCGGVGMLYSYGGGVVTRVRWSSGAKLFTVLTGSFSPKQLHRNLMDV